MKAVVKNGELVITIPLTPVDKAPLSSSGKNKVLYSSGGFKAEGQHRINLTVIPAR